MENCFRLWLEAIWVALQGRAVDYGLEAFCDKGLDLFWLKSAGLCRLVSTVRCDAMPAPGSVSEDI